MLQGWWGLFLHLDMLLCSPCFKIELVVNQRNHRPGELVTNKYESMVYIEEGNFYLDCCTCTLQLINHRNHATPGLASIDKPFV